MTVKTIFDEEKLKDYVCLDEIVDKTVKEEEVPTFIPPYLDILEPSLSLVAGPWMQGNRR